MRPRIAAARKTDPTGFETEYEDFREVDGVWVPFREINHAGGKRVAETVVREVVWSPDDLGPFAPN